MGCHRFSSQASRIARLQPQQVDQSLNDSPLQDFVRFPYALAAYRTEDLSEGRHNVFVQVVEIRIFRETWGQNRLMLLMFQDSLIEGLSSS